MPVERYAATAQTTNSTPTVVFSTPVPEGETAYFVVDFQIINSGLTLGASGTISALFLRPVGGNVIRATGNNGAQKANLSLIGNFINSPNIEMVANTTTQRAELRLTGLSGVTLNWRYTPNVRRN